MVWALDQLTGSTSGKIVLVTVANYANEHGECWPSQKTIARQSELGERATRDWLKKLEANGFIKRKRRHRADGSRTSDLIILNLTRSPNSGNDNLTANSAARSDLTASDAEPSGTSQHSYRQEMPGIEPSLKPLKEPSSGASARVEDGFKKLWDDWPSKERPDKMKAAKWAFDRLPIAEQASAVQQARRFRRLAKARKDMALMIPYLKNREFKDLAEAPEVNADGKFIITPDRPEWPYWLEHLREEYSDVTVDRLEARQSFFADSRWPPNSAHQSSGPAEMTESLKT